jgi:hypothetical protein
MALLVHAGGLALQSELEADGGYAIFLRRLAAASEEPPAPETG